jgi:hypothetical protein
VLAQGSWEDLTYLLIEWIEPGEGTPAIYEHLGRGLAADRLSVGAKKI